MVSASVDRADASLVRLLHGDERSSIGLVEHDVPWALAGTWDVEPQAMHPGSFGLVQLDGRLDGLDAVSGHLFVMPTVVGRTTPQGVLTGLTTDDEPLWALAIEGDGDLVLSLCRDARSRDSVRLVGAMSRDRWHSVSFTVDWANGAAELWSTGLTRTGTEATGHGHLTHGASVADRPARSLLLAASGVLRRHNEPRALETFNGKIERPTLFEGGLDEAAVARLAKGVDPARSTARIVVDLDLGAEADAWEIHDRVVAAPVGRLFNAPLRRCTSHAWRGETVTPALDPSAYAAVRFHADDVHHADWRPTRTWTVPEDLASGIYAVRLRADGVEDRIPFVVRPPRGRAGADVALWLPTFTYAAYANARSLVGARYEDFVPELPPEDRQLARHPEWGSSLYDRHPDGTGIAISSLSRPVPNLRPGYRAPLTNAPRHLAADLYLVHWLDQLRVPVDVVTDEDVHAEGVTLLERYATVITGSHPEYVTGRQLDAIERYTEHGGRLMYLGGNGFYWVTSIAADETTTVEVRRGHAGTRSWDAVPGELHHQFTGEPGGLWRHRGRPPHQLVGVGFVAEGRDGRNRAYRRCPDSFRREGSWAFEGIAPDEPIGADGLVMAGAAGDEIDSANPELGTPADTLVLASAEGHGDAYWLVVEDLLFNADGLSGSRDDRIRADVTLTPMGERGAVFSVGSMSWVGALSHRGYANPVARLTENVLDAFRSGASPWVAGEAPVTRAGVR